MVLEDNKTLGIYTPDAPTQYIPNVISLYQINSCNTAIHNQTNVQLIYNTFLNMKRQNAMYNDMHSLRKSVVNIQ